MHPRFPFGGGPLVVGSASRVGGGSGSESGSAARINTHTAYALRTLWLAASRCSGDHCDAPNAAIKRAPVRPSVPSRNSWLHLTLRSCVSEHAGQRRDHWLPSFLRHVVNSTCARLRPVLIGALPPLAMIEATIGWNNVPPVLFHCSTQAASNGEVQRYTTVSRQRRACCGLRLNQHNRDAKTGC